MPTLVLPPRITPDTDAMFEAAQAAGWEALRLDGWRVPGGLNGHDVALYGEPLFADVVAPSLGVALLQAPFDWLPGLPERYRRREVTFTTLAAAREYSRPVFVKPADDKCFAARVYASGAELPDASVLPDETPVLISEIVTWHIEYRCFVAERAVGTCSPYWRDKALAQAEDGTWPSPLGEQDAALAFAARRSCGRDPTRLRARRRPDRRSRLGGGRGEQRLGRGHLWVRSCLGSAGAAPRGRAAG